LYVQVPAIALNQVAAAGDGLLYHSHRVRRLVAEILRRAPRFAAGLDTTTVIHAAFLHDLGKSCWPSRYFELPYHELSPRDHAIMRSHPTRGSQMAAAYGCGEEVCLLIAQHHERPGGAGYPRKLVDPHPAALLIGAADAFCACLEPRPYRPDPLPLFEALREAAKVLPEVVPLIKDIGKDFIVKDEQPG